MNERPDKESVFISGGGPVGLAAALELTRRGFHARVIDPDPAPSAESRALAINARTLDLLEPSGATERLLAAGLKVRSFHARFHQQTLFTLDITRLDHRFNFLLSLPQSDTERILTDTLVALGGKLERNLALQSFETTGSKVLLTLSDGSRAEADWLVGADGARSVVRKSLSLDFPGGSEPQTFGLADVELDDWPFPWDMGVATLRTDHIIGFIPMREGFGRFVSSRPDTLQILPAEAKVRRVTWQSEFRIHYRQVSSYQKGRVFLAGDAAHIHSPLGGRGMNLGIEDACWLAWLMDTGRAEEYTALRHPVGAAVLKATATPTGLITSQSLASQAIRRWIIPFILGSAPVQRRLLPGMSGLSAPAAPWLTGR